MRHLAFVALRPALVALRPALVALRPALIARLRPARPPPETMAKSSAAKAQPAAAPQSAAQRAAMLHKASLISRKLQQLYPQPPKTFLHHNDPFTLLVAVVLSAQSLDAKVNQVTPELFRIAPTPHKMAHLGAPRIQQLIQKIGLAPQKARNIAALSATICEHHHGHVPRTFDHLESLAGVGHKTASVVMMQAFNEPAFPVDTHIHRLACRWGCGDAKSVPKTERNLKLWFPHSSTWGELHTRIILFGREYCPARNHDMDACPVCSFAATDEARAANNANPKKFVAPVNHANPYSIRELPPSRVDSESDSHFTPTAVQKRRTTVKSTPKRRKATAPAAPNTKQLQNDQQNAATKPSTRRRKAAEKAHQPDVQVEKRPTRRRRTVQKQDQPSNDAGIAGSTKRAAPGTTRQTSVGSVENVQDRQQQKAEEMGEGRRTSSRLALKRKQKGLA
ncbi:Endonuclease III [Gracilariopsis chorda]|uniref:Endonuclease III n=1 Tax=Gracilariopsis chorda TaxID=448386 RepID=A0A2V3IFB4_9FLOR|nr:Endonuclease III [Gracilariopsis chorda]|eukprot:PXF40785.1 Endonuclease III [Gracilariopsis chorda]